MENEHWMLDRKVPVALIAAILLQSAVGIWWAATQSTKIDSLERQAGAAVVAVQNATASSASLSERLTKLETKFDYVVDGLVEVKALLRQMQPAPVIPVPRR